MMRTKTFVVVVVLFLAGVSANVNDLPHRGPCNRGGGAAGKCIDLNSFACSTTPLVGKCPGAKNIRCCQGVVSDKNSGGEVSEAPGPTPAVNEAPPSTTLQPTSTGEVQSAPPSTPNTNLNPGVAYDDDPGNSYRVRRDTYGSLPRNSPLLVAVPSSGGQRKLHTLCAARFNAMRAAALEAGFDFKVASGWREHRFQESEEVYCAAMRQRYPDLSCRQARSRIAFKSPHETGLALDLGSPSPFRPSFTHKDAQLRSPAFAWLKQNAHRFGITPYKHEPWHWECVLTVDAYRTGVEFTDDYNVRVAQ